MTCARVRRMQTEVLGHLELPVAELVVAARAQRRVIAANLRRPSPKWKRAEAGTCLYRAARDTCATNALSSVNAAWRLPSAHIHLKYARPMRGFETVCGVCPLSSVSSVRCESGSLQTLCPRRRARVRASIVRPNRSSQSNHTATPRVHPTDTDATAQVAWF